ncbi:DUF3783 domain-containing protein [Clostridium sp. DJ247]|uniref:DUF3783 domain-containing protein n=1 Tax=Clostridium sp. DJ247 TaxID=2726188 RepID=UPI001627AEA5|nr:DUF3783 domain-containing protein [Clostridium sp. DJ247]MBC2580912.1 DUF3783 domain-containing protein [Clostridium sp. DJ247]
MENNKIALIYGLDEEEKQLIYGLLTKNNLPIYKVIDESMGKMKVKDILSGLKLEVYNAHLPKEKVVLFNNFDDQELNDMIIGIREGFKIRPIIAVVTETSIDWSFEYLLEHLIEEREWHRKRSR